jgi:hypothetical protein
VAIGLACFSAFANAYDTFTFSPSICVWAFNALAQSDSFSKETKANLIENNKKNWNSMEEKAYCITLRSGPTFRFCNLTNFAFG